MTDQRFAQLVMETVLIYQGKVSEGRNASDALTDLERDLRALRAAANNVTNTWWKTRVDEIETSMAIRKYGGL